MNENIPQVENCRCKTFTSLSNKPPFFLEQAPIRVQRVVKVGSFPHRMR